MRAEKCLRVRCEHTPHKHHQLLCSLQRSPGSLTWREELTWAARFQQPPPLSFFQLDNQAAPAFIESRCSGKGLKKQKTKKQTPVQMCFHVNTVGGGSCLRRNSSAQLLVQLGGKVILRSCSSWKTEGRSWGLWEFRCSLEHPSRPGEHHMSSDK